MFSSKRTISFYDCDPAGILFFGRIFEICHSAYEEMIGTFGLKEDYWSNSNYAVPIIKSEAQYLNRIKYGDIITTEISLTEIKPSSFELSFECINQNNELCAKVKIVYVFVDRKEWKKTNIYDDIRKGLLKHRQ